MHAPPLISALAGIAVSRAENLKSQGIHSGCVVRNGFLGLSVAFLVIMAGCVGTTADPQTHEPPSTVDANQGTGSIKGRVIDDEGFPIAGATAQVVKNANRSEEPLSANTNTTGEFLFKGLKPDKYFVVVNKLGYMAPAAKIVTVVEDAPTLTFFELVPQRIAEPWSEAIPYTVRFTTQVCTLVLGSSSCTTVYSSANITKTKEVKENETGLLETAILEAEFEHEVSSCKAGVRTTLRAPKLAATWATAPENTTSPTRLFVPRTGDHANAMADSKGNIPFDTSGPWSVYSWPFARGSLGTPVDVSCMTETPVRIWWSLFYGAPAPIDHTALPPK
jgi:hypothetical protein